MRSALRRIDVRMIRLAQDLCSVNCLSGWAYYNLTCLQVINTTMIWIEAELYCQSLVPGGHLVSIHSKQNNNFVLNLLQKENITHSRVWLGSSDIYQDGVRFWTDGSKWDYYNWLAGRPYIGIFCNTMLIHEDPGLWSDEYCGWTPFPFICMYPIEYD
ncbi:lectin-like [Scyliorhinus canicula]|uniref:lectin-like n=1 Tax=Scyliorhinus canicula TaxID=7830 RepID=UPI0018F55828|nr:lectin-like [Scyliorhinus canicula]